MLSNNPPLEMRLPIDYEALAAEAAAAVADNVIGPITADEYVSAHTERAKFLKGISAKIERARKAEKAQILEDGRTVEGFFAKIAKPVADETQAVIAAINAWQKAQLAAQREREREEAEARRIFDESAAVAPVAAKDAGRVVSSTGHVAATARTVWRHRLVNLADVPREYMTLNDSAVVAAIARGVREIPGLAIEESVITTIR